MRAPPQVRCRRHCRFRRRLAEWTRRAASSEGRAHPPDLGGRVRHPDVGVLDHARAASFELLEARSRVPVVRPGSVPRTPLVNCLRASGVRPIVTVLAPAGYGKTTVLAQWADRDRRPFVWVTIGEGDDDPLLLASCVASALRHADVDPAVLDVLESPRRLGVADAPAAHVRARLLPASRRAGPRQHPPPPIPDERSGDCRPRRARPRRIGAGALRSRSAAAPDRTSAGGRPAPGGRRRGARVQPPGGRSHAPHARVGGRRGPGRGADGADRGLARRRLPGCPRDEGPARRIEPGAPPARRRPLRGRLLRLRAPLPAESEGRAVPHANRGARPDVRAALRRSAPDHRVGRTGWSRSRGPTCSSYRSVGSAPGTGTTASFGTSFARSWSGGSPSSSSRSTGGQRRGASRTPSRRPVSSTRTSPETSTASRGSSASWCSRCAPRVGPPRSRCGSSGSTGSFGSSSTRRSPSSGRGCTFCAAGRRRRRDGWGRPSARRTTGTWPTAHERSSRGSPWFERPSAGTGWSRCRPMPSSRCAGWASSSAWRPTALLLHGVAQALLGEADHGDESLSDAAETAESAGAIDIQIVALVERSLLAAASGREADATALAAQARALVGEHRLEEHPFSAIAFAASARDALRARRPGAGARGARKRPRSSAGADPCAAVVLGPDEPRARPPGSLPPRRPRSPGVGGGCIRGPRSASSSGGARGAGGGVT